MTPEEYVQRCFDQVTEPLDSLDIEVLKMSMEEAIGQAIAEEREACAKIPEWVKSSERLPTIPEKYVVIIEDGDVCYLSTRSFNPSIGFMATQSRAATYWLDQLKFPTLTTDGNGCDRN